MGRIGQRLTRKKSKGKEKNSKGNFLIFHVISCSQIECNVFLALITMH
jgi:hypothetical protein